VQSESDEMMTIDEMILALVATGKFTLPKRVLRNPNDSFEEWMLMDYNPHGGWGQTVVSADAHDLIAMHFAREAEAAKMDYSCEPEFSDAMQLGDSAAAIAALYEAMKASE
jgi:hypothetical protein